MKTSGRACSVIWYAYNAVSGTVAIWVIIAYVQSSLKAIFFKSGLFLFNFEDLRRKEKSKEMSVFLTKRLLKERNNHDSEEKIN